MEKMSWQRLMAISVLVIVLAIASASSAFAFKDDEETKNYIYRLYPIIEEENITINFVTMKYVNWAGLYTPNKIQINELYVLSDNLLNLVMKHELKHHFCLKEKKNIDMQHKICFKK